MKNDYNRNTFWVWKDENGTPNYYIKVNGVMVPVSEEVYKVCRNSYMKIAYQNKKDTHMLISLDKENDCNSNFNNLLTAPDDTEILESIKFCINELEQPYKDVLVKYFFEEKTMVKTAQEMGVSESTISNWVAKGIKKLKKVLEKVEIE